MFCILSFVVFRSSKVIVTEKLVCDSGSGTATRPTIGQTSGTGRYCLMVSITCNSSDALHWSARLIQWSWRCYAASESSTSTVTWKTHIRPYRHEGLSSQEKTAVRFLRIVKYYIARRRFSTALKPYDIKDVLEQYAAGHADVVGRVKHMQSRINTLQSSVSSNMKSLAESKVSLSVRMAHMESISVDLQNKVSELMIAQDRDKTIIHTLVSILGQKTICDTSAADNRMVSSSAPNKTRRNSC